MSHIGKHAWGPWSTETETNAAGETQTMLVRCCLAPRCGAVDTERGAIVEVDPSDYRYAKVQPVGEEPSD